MSSKLITEVLNLQTDQLMASKPATVPARVNATAAQRAELNSLMAVAARVQHWLAPVLPSPAFRARLRDGLHLAAHHEQMRRAVSAEKESRYGVPRWGWLIGAAALGSAAGLIAVMMRVRHARKIPDDRTSVTTEPQH